MNHFAEAYESYTKAINVSLSNPNNYIYYCNRGTASFHLKNYEDTVKGYDSGKEWWIDCQESIRLNKNYVKAYIRLAKALMALNRISEAIEMYVSLWNSNNRCEKGLEVIPNNEELSQMLQSLKQSQPQNTPDFSSIQNMISSLSENPELREMASNLQSGNMSFSDMMQNPTVQNMWMMVDEVID